MSFVSQTENEYAAIVTRWKANCPVVAARRSFANIGGPVFDRPVVPAFTTTTRETTLAGLVWVSLDILGTPSSGRAQGISPTSKTYRSGIVVQSVHFPLHHGLDFVMPIVDDAREVFQRSTLTLTAGFVHFRDSDQPVRADLPEMRQEGWGFFNVITPYWTEENN